MVTAFFLFIFISQRYLCVIYEENCWLWDPVFHESIQTWQFRPHFSKWISACTFYLLHHHSQNQYFTKKFFSLIKPNPAMRQSKESAANSSQPTSESQCAGVHLANRLICSICQMSQCNKNLVFLLLFLFIIYSFVVTHIGWIVWG